MNERLNMGGYRANLAPIDFEVDCGPLRVRGALPPGLAGVLVRNGPNPLHPEPAQHWFAGRMVHDFAFSARHLLFPVTPLTASKARMHAGLPPYAWEPQFGSFVGVMRRDGSGAVEWWKGPACFVFHVMNAWEDDDGIDIDVMQFDAPPNFTWPDGRAIDGAGHARLCRWTLDRRGDERVFTSAIIADISGEFPRIDERFAGAPYRHGWLAAHSDDDDGGGLFSQITHVDHANPQALDIYRLADGDATSEPVFVPRTIDAAEGDGWILAVVYRGAEQRSDLLVFDALRIAAGPLATVEIPHRVPNGFHGNWLAAREQPA